MRWEVSVSRGEHWLTCKRWEHNRRNNRQVMCRSRRTQKKYERGKKKRGVKTEKKSQVDTRDVCVCVVCVRAQWVRLITCSEGTGLNTELYTTSKEKSVLHWVVADEKERRESAKERKGGFLNKWKIANIGVEHGRSERLASDMTWLDKLDI